MPDLEIFVDGRSHRVAAGVSVAAALINSGQLAWRQTRAGAARGMFCGIGVCFDCLVTVNGVRDLRACLIEVREGDRIETAAADAD